MMWDLKDFVNYTEAKLLVWSEYLEDVIGFASSSFTLINVNSKVF